MNSIYVIETMNKKEVQVAVDWARNEGWNPGLHDADCFFQTDCHGFFAGKLDGQIIAVGSAVLYDDQYAFCGFYIVDKSYRGKGYGLELTKHRLAYVGNRNAGIDGVMNMLDKYARLGYKLAHNNARYQGSLNSAVSSIPVNLVSIDKIPFDELLAYDRRHFPAFRPSFLKCWLHQEGGKGLAWLNHQTIAGYGFIRPCQKGFKIGPLFADTPSIAEELFIHLAAHAKRKPFYLDIPENNPEAKALVSRHHLEKVFETARMYLKGEPNIEHNHVYGITSFELG
ncbi:GNAT family N-acetyltransferase [Legionella impletisoli]|uniref:Acetyltransferase n=1 Tax=Legionella impletisoli TaxID=343510 RepID=A0A917JWX4_9GAMM|nr:GNAT family N-acetyltransferase [Legionella impletisoli]GGI87988.1 acetyltransferase [Legionella impletisoli]